LFTSALSTLREAAKDTAVLFKKPALLLLLHDLNDSSNFSDAFKECKTLKVFPEL